jgi:hypothetical protein
MRVSEVNDGARPLQGRGRLGSDCYGRSGGLGKRQPDERTFSEASASRDKSIRVHAMFMTSISDPASESK